MKIVMGMGMGMGMRFGIGMRMEAGGESVNGPRNSNLCSSSIEREMECIDGSGTDMEMGIEVGLEVWSALRTGSGVRTRREW